MRIIYVIVLVVLMVLTLTSLAKATFVSQTLVMEVIQK